MSSSRPEELLAEVVERFGADRIVLACSFQKESSVLLELVLEAAPTARVVTLDTGALFPETLDTWRRVEERYGITVEGWRGEWVDRLWERDPDACCDMRKVQPLRRALAGADCWITGLRRDQSPSRADAPELHWDERQGLWKANPLATWTERDVWSFIMERGLPYNELHDRGYGSIGCTHCTAPGEGRAGRWAGTGRTECGLHGAAAAAG
jgi:phosphoadenosine phosphosulfate reductase